MPKLGKVRRARALKEKQRMNEISLNIKLNKAGDDMKEECKEDLPMTEEEWLSCQTDANKLVEPNNRTEETYFLPEESILPDIASDVPDTKDILPSQLNVIDEESTLEEKCFADNKNILVDEWLLEQTLCRCCHAEGDFSSLQDTAPSEHITYNDMLSTCFNIQLFPVSGGLSAALGAVCGLCAARMRDAHSFREQVRASEARLLHLYQRNCIKVPTDEIEVKAEAPCTINQVEQEVEPSIVTPKGKNGKKTYTEKRKKPAKGKSLLENAPQNTTRQKPVHVLPAVYCTRIGDSYKCTRCEKIYNNRHGVREHFKIIHLKLTRAFECTHCPNTFKSDIRLTIHKLEAHNINEQVKCNACDKTFNTQKQLSSHLDTYHMMGIKIQCSMCDYECYGKITLNKHMVKHKTTKDHRCKYCKKSFLRSTNLKLHERIHTGDKRKACAVCGQAFVQKASLNYHMAKQHPEGRGPAFTDCTQIGATFKCNHCENSYASRYTCRNHFHRTHLNKVRMIQCAHCSETFTKHSSSLYMMHKLEVHNIDDRFKCNACEKIYSRKQLLRKHMNSYHMMGEKIKCAMCDYVCYDSIAMRRHCVKHRTKKDFQCKYCKKSFLRKNTLSFHERIHTGDKRKACAECGQAFVQKASLNYHMAKHHPEVKF